jgi:hypothetical protein
MRSRIESFGFGDRPHSLQLQLLYSQAIAQAHASLRRSGEWVLLPCVGNCCRKLGFGVGWVGICCQGSCEQSRLGATSIYGRVCNIRHFAVAKHSLLPNIFLLTHQRHQSLEGELNYNYLYSVD